MKHDMNKRILLRSEDYILRRYRLGFLALTSILVGFFYIMERKNSNKKTNFKAELQSLKEKTEKHNKEYDPGIII